MFNAKMFLSRFLPGFREIRTPLLVGFMWLLPFVIFGIGVGVPMGFLYLLDFEVHPSAAKIEEAAASADKIIGSAWKLLLLLAVPIGLLVYLLGSVSCAISSSLVSLISNTFDRRASPPGGATSARRPATGEEHAVGFAGSIRRRARTFATRRDVVSTLAVFGGIVLFLTFLLPSLFQLTITSLPTPVAVLAIAGIVAVWHRTTKKSTDVGYEVAAARLLHSSPTVHQEYSRLRAQAELHAGAALPLLVYGSVSAPAVELLTILHINVSATLSSQKLIPILLVPGLVLFFGAVTRFRAARAIAVAGIDELPAPREDLGAITDADELAEDS